MPSQQMDEIIEKFQISTDSYNQYNLDSAETRARNLESVLKGNNPIFYNEPASLTITYDDSYYSSNFPSYYDNGEVKRIEVYFDGAKDNPDAYFKPLDI
ncbi:5174_t:CDS:1, partial [Funneliformis geosporum]